MVLSLALIWNAKGLKQFRIKPFNRWIVFLSNHARKEKMR